MKIFKEFMKWYRKRIDRLVLLVSALMFLVVSIMIYIRSNYLIIENAEMLLWFVKIAGIIICVFQLLNVYVMITRKKKAEDYDADEK